MESETLFLASTVFAGLALGMWLVSKSKDSELDDTSTYSYPFEMTMSPVPGTSSSAQSPKTVYYPDLNGKLLAEARTAIEKDRPNTPIKVYQSNPTQKQLKDVKGSVVVVVRTVYVKGKEQRVVNAIPYYVAMKSLDLFSGIGGLTHALRGIFEPVMYCEIAPSRVAALKNLFAKKYLPESPIHQDVRTLEASSVPKIDALIGGWPCFPAGFMVATRDEGYKPIEEVNGTEHVLTHTGQYCKVNNLQRKVHPGTLYSIKCKGHFRTIECTDEHPFYVLPPKAPDGRISTPCWIQAKDLTPEYSVGVPINMQDSIPEFNVTYNVNQFTSHVESLRLDSPDHFWMMGLFLGDGWIQDDKKRNGSLQYRICFVVNHVQEDMIVERLQRVLKVRKKDCMQGCTKYVVSHKLWWTILKMFGRYAHGKRVPEWIQSAPTHLIEAFVDGYMTADGCKRQFASGSTEWRMATVSLEVALGMQRVLAKLGHAFGVSKTHTSRFITIMGRKCNQRDRYTVYGRVDKKRQSASFVANGYAWYAISDVRKVTKPSQKLVYNMEVDGDNSYTVDNTAVHNCVGFSTVGQRQGFENQESALFSEVDRLIGELKPKIVFQENVPGVASGDGLERVLECMHRHGYDCNWLVTSGYSVGSPQQRWRWFCLAVRRDTDIKELCIDLKQQFTRYDWSKEPVERMTLASVSQSQAKLSMLGNSVIPDCVRAAFMTLWTHFTVPLDALWTMNRLQYVRPAPSARELLPPPTSKRYYGCMVDGKAYMLPKLKMPDKPDYNLQMIPTSYTHILESKAAAEKLITETYTRALWGTPRGGCKGPLAQITQRSRGELYTMLRFEKDTPDELRSGRPNTEWVCWLMGFPLDWLT